MAQPKAYSHPKVAKINDATNVVMNSLFFIAVRSCALNFPCRGRLSESPKRDRRWSLSRSAPPQPAICRLCRVTRDKRALGSVVADARKKPRRGVVKSVVADFSTSEGRTAARDGLKTKFAGSQLADVKAKSIDSLRQVSALLATRAPGAFKAWLRQISQSTAESATEGGGLLGLGGVQVSDAEKATLDEISSALPSECNLGARRDSSMADVFGISR